MNPQLDQLDQQIGSLLEAWINRNVDADQCRFCNESIGESKPPDERYCDEECEAYFKTVGKARNLIGKRDLEQRGFD